MYIKKKNLWEIAMIEQIYQQYEDNTLEILRANLELKHMFVTLPSAILLFCRRLMNIH